MGLIVPKHRQNSVERNRLKRRLRELLRLELLHVLHNLPLAQDIVVRAGPKAYSRNFAELKSEMQYIVRRITSEQREKSDVC